MGVVSALCIAAGVGGGYWLSEATKTGAAVVFAGLAVGMLAAIATTYFTIRRFF
jgi:nitrate reductase gamma subunit